MKKQDLETKIATQFFNSIPIKSLVELATYNPSMLQIMCFSLSLDIQLIKEKKHLEF
jgi:hypothetical protein